MYCSSLIQSGSSRIRTCNPRFRRPVLYPIKPWILLGENLRRGGDSNPRNRYTPLAGLANQYLRPLGHLSICFFSSRCAPCSWRDAFRLLALPVLLMLMLRRAAASAQHQPSRSTSQTSTFFLSLFGCQDVSAISGGGGGIRTPGSLHYGGFQDRCLRPLGHSSDYSEAIRRGV